jgi:hypothetical protein
MAWTRFLPVFTLIASCHAVTVYYAPGQTPLASGSAAAAAYTGAAAYNPTTLIPPPVPTQKPPMQFDIGLKKGETNNLSIKQSGSFVGFSIEMSVVNQVCKSFGL